MENQPLQELAKRLNLTDPEPEEYILTKEEEDRVLDNVVTQKQKHLAWKMSGLGYTDEQIIAKIKEVDWMKEISKEQVLANANSIKHQDIWHSEQRRKEKEAQETAAKQLLERCTAKYMFQLMKWTSKNSFGKDLIVNNSNKHLITTLCYFLSNDDRFEKELGFSFKKGLLIRGISGLGKTHLVRCLEKNELFPILVLSMIEISDEIKQEGEYQIHLGSNKIIYLDDVGTEESTVNHYGTKINFFKQFIELMYLKNQNKTFSGIMISTNNSFSEMEEKYGFRVRSRIKDMFNIIDVTGKDMRG